MYRLPILRSTCGRALVRDPTWPLARGIDATWGERLHAPTRWWECVPIGPRPPGGHRCPSRPDGVWPATRRPLVDALSAGPQLISSELTVPALPGPTTGIHAHTTSREIRVTAERNISEARHQALADGGGCCNCSGHGHRGNGD